MPLSSIVQVLLRLSALNWFVTGLVQLVPGIMALRSEASSVLQFAVPSIWILTGALFWVFAPFLSRQLAKGADSSVTLDGVSLLSLYSTAFVGLGLWFALANFAGVFNWIHYCITYSSGTQGMGAAGPGSFYNLSEAALTFLAGVALVATARIWARKLTRDGEQSGAAANDE